MRNKSSVVQADILNYVVDFGTQMPPESPSTAPLNKVRFATDYIPLMPHCVASFLSRGIPSGGKAPPGKSQLLV